jgi:lysophospholipase
MELFALDNNPIPEDAVVGAICAADGVKLRYARWRGTGRRTQGTVCLFQGRGDCIERYFEMIGDLRERGFAVATLDWRGQGLSDRRLRNPRKGHVDSFAEYDRDLDSFMEQVALPDCPPPHFALAHSTGALICLRAARDGRARFNRIVAESPLVDMASTPIPAPLMARLVALAVAVGLGEASWPGKAGAPLSEIRFDGNLLTGDPKRFARNREISSKLRAVTVGRPTFGWLYAAWRAIQEASDPRFAPAVRIPTLVVGAALDQIVSVRAVEALAAELRAGALVVIPGARHEIMMERDTVREQFWAAFDAFIPGSSR